MPVKALGNSPGRNPAESLASKTELVQKEHQERGRTEEVGVPERWILT